MPHNDMPCPKSCIVDNTVQINDLMDKLQLLKADNESLKSQISHFEEQKNLIIARFETYIKEFKEESVKKTDYMDRQNNRLRKALIIMTALLLVVLFVIIGVLVYDVTHPEIGWLRYA
jgi:predicted RNase H-like nuclease (RuvC/YqgF family)